MAESGQRKWSGRSSSGSLANWGLRLLMKCLPITVAYWILYAVVPFYMLFARKGYRAIYGFYRKRFALSPFRAFVWTYKNHYLFGQTLLDKFAVFAGKSDFLTFIIDGEQYMDKVCDGENGSLLASAHVGNFEIAGYFLRPNNKTINSLIFGGEQRVFQQNRAKAFERQHVNLIAINDDLSHIFYLSQAARQKEIISMTCDRYFSGAKNVELDFLGSKAKFPLGAFYLACRYELDVLSVFVIKQSNRSYKAYIRPVVGDTPEQMCASYVASVESVVLENPLQWFNFYDFFDGR